MINITPIIELSSNKPLFKTMVNNALSIACSRLEYRTTDEGLSCATYFICRKSAVANDATLAFSTLITHKIHFYEEWDITETKFEHIDSIIDLWLIPELSRAEFQALFNDETLTDLQ